MCCAKHSFLALLGRKYARTDKRETYIPLIMNIKDNYKQIIDYCEQLDYSDLDNVFEYADNEVFSYSSEISLIIMINCVIKQPKWLDNILEHTELIIHYEGNMNTYRYILSKYQNEENKDVLYILEKFITILQNKYSKMGVNLK